MEFLCYIVAEVLAFESSTNLVGEVKNIFLNKFSISNKSRGNVFHFDCSHSTTIVDKTFVEFFHVLTQFFLHFK